MGLFDDLVTEPTKQQTPGLFDDLSPEPAQVQPSGMFADLQPAPAGLRQPERTVMGTVKDLGISLGKGFVGAGESAVGIADIATGGAAGGALETLVGYDPAGTKEALSEFYSPAQQEANRRLSEAQGFTETVKAGLRNPSTIVQAAVESAPLILSGGGIARKVTQVAPKISPIVASAIGEGTVGAGIAAEQTRQETGTLTPKQTAMAVGSGVGTGLFTLAGGRLAKKFGFEDINTLLASGKISKGKTVKDIAKSIVGGGITEGVFEELPQSAQEQVWANAATDKPLFEGVPEASAMGLLTGAAIGSGANVLTARTKQNRDVVHKELLDKLIPGVQISVADGQVTIDRGEQGPPVNIPVADLALHLQEGGTLDTLPQEVFGERRMFAGPQPLTPEESALAQEVDTFTTNARRQVQNANQRGLRQAATPTTGVPLAPAENLDSVAAEALFQAYEPQVQREDFTARETATVPQDAAEALSFGREAIAYNQRRNVPAEQAPSLTPEEIAYEEYAPEVPSIEQDVPVAAAEQAPAPILTKSGKPFSSAKTAEVSLKKQGLDPAEYTIQKQGDGFAAVKKSNVVDKTADTVYSGNRGEGSTYKYKVRGEATSEQGNTDTQRLRSFFKGVSRPGVRQSISAVEVSPSERATADRIAGLFGRRVSFFQADKGAGLPAGLIDRNNPGTIYINVDSGFASPTIIGHEIVHSMKTEAPKLFEQLFEAATKQNIKTSAFKDYQKRLGETYLLRNKKVSNREIAEEMIADFVGDRFARPDFWESLAKQDRSVFNRVAAFVKYFLTDLINSLGNIRNYQADEFFNNVIKMRDATVDAIAKYGGAKAIIKDAKNADVAFSIATDSLQRNTENVTQILKSLADPKGTSSDILTQLTPHWLAVAPLHTVVQTFGKKVKQIGEFAQHLGRVDAVKTEIVDTSAVLYAEAESLAKKGVGVDAFNRAAALSSFNQITPWFKLLEQDWVPKDGTVQERLAVANTAWINSGMKAATQKNLHEAYTEARTAYEGLKSSELQEAYKKIVGHLRRIRDRERNNLLQYIESTSEEGTDLRNQLMAQFNASFSELKGAYWPLSRTGDFRMEYTDTEGFRTVEHFTTAAERRAAKRQLEEWGVDPETIREDYKDKTPQGAAAIPHMLIGQLSEVVEAKYLAEVDPNDPAQVAAAQQRAQSVVDDMNQIWLRWQPETSALKNSLRRKSIKGFSAEMLQSYLSYTQRHASNIAWTEQGRKIEDTLSSFSADINEKQKQPGADTTTDRMLLNDMRNRVQALRSVNVGRFASALGKLSTAYYMTSPSIAVVQMSQLGVLTLPKLATMHSWAKASKAIAQGTKDAFSRKFTRTAMFGDPVVEDAYESLRAKVTDDNRDTPQASGKQIGDRLYSEKEQLEKIAKLSPYQQQLLVLRESMARNLLDISAAHEAYEIARGKNPGGVRSKIFDLAMKPMSLSELASRKTAVLATHQLSSSKGKNFFESMNDIAEVVNDTLYSYAKENKGSALQGGLTRVVLQFQHYRIMTALRLAMLFNNTVRGESPEIRKAARKEFVGIMGMSGALAGVVGLPLANVVFAVLNSTLGDEDEPYDAELEFNNWLTENFGENVASAVAYGTPAVAIGADLSRRTGLGDIYGMQQEPPPGLHGRNLAAWWAASQLGPIFSVGQGWVQGYDEAVNKGRYLRGLEAATPKPIRDTLKALRVNYEGLRTSSGKQLIAEGEIAPDDVFMLLLGFNVEDVAKAQRSERSLRKISTQISERRGRLIRDAAQAILQGGDMQDAYKDIQAFNRKMPRFAIKSSDVGGRIRSIMKGEKGVTGPRERAIVDQYEIPVYLTD